MQNENPNNDFHWKSKLKDLESLPGEKFNKDAAWDRLHMRMQGKGSNKKVLWYWTAAACLVIALFVSWFFSKENENTLVKNNSIKEKSQSSPASNYVPEDRDSIAFIPSTPVEKKLPANPVENKNKIITSVDHKILTVENVAAKESKEEIIEPEINNNSVTPISSQINIIAVVPEKKKLRVVHINELGDPVEEVSAVTRKTEVHSFQMKFANQEVFVNPSVASKKAGFTILSSKNSPN